MKEDPETLFELMLSADRFCRIVREQLNDRCASEELRLKLAQSIGSVQRLRQLYERDELLIGNSVARAEIRQLLLSMMWVCFYARDSIDRKTFRLAVNVQATFTYLLSVN